MGTNFELKMALVREGHVRPSRFCRALPSGYRTLNQALPYFGSKNTVPRIKSHGLERLFHSALSAGEESFNKKDYFDNIGLLLLSLV